MPSPIEAFRSARQRINPEGLAVGAAVSYASPAVMLPLEAGLTYAVHELAKEVDPNVLKIVAIGILGVANMVSVAVETRAFQEHNYSASPVGSTLNILTGKPIVSSVGEHMVNYAQLSVLNPINAAAIVTSDNQLLIESAGATSLALTVWFTTINTLISTGRVQQFVDKMKNVRQSIGKIFKR